MQGQHSNQSSFFGLIYEDLIPQDHKRIVRQPLAGTKSAAPGGGAWLTEALEVARSLGTKPPELFDEFPELREP